MNKLVLIKTIKDIINLYLSNKLTTEEIDSIIEKYRNLSVNDNEIAYGEADLISFLFANIPYFQITSLLNNIIVYLNCITKDSPKQKCIASLIEAYLSDLLPSINARLLTEVYTHINELLLIFYQSRQLESQRTIKLLTRNIINPNILASMDTAEQINYTQETIISFEQKEEHLRESISRSNFNKKNSVERSVKKTLYNYYDELSYEELLREIDKVLREYSLYDSTNSDLIRDELTYHLSVIHKFAIKKWEEPKNIDENQLTLTLQ